MDQSLLYVFIKIKSERNILRKVNLQLICSSNWAESWRSKQQVKTKLDLLLWRSSLIFTCSSSSDLQIFKYSKSKRFFKFFFVVNAMHTYSICVWNRFKCSFCKFPSFYVFKHEFIFIMFKYILYLFVFFFVVPLPLWRRAKYEINILFMKRSKYKINILFIMKKSKI
jgi:hypothetical protein